MKNEVKEIRESIDSIQSSKSLPSYNLRLSAIVQKIKDFENQYKESIEKFYYSDLNLKLGRINGYTALLSELEISIETYEDLPGIIKLDITDTIDLLEQFYSDIPESLK